MKKHAELGYEMLKYSERKLLKASAIIAHEHHEKWDGTGYPRKLKGHNIHIFGRIVAIADVFDALSCERAYKDAWPMDKIVTLFTEEKGIHFDTNLIELLLNNIEQFIEIKDEISDI